MNLTDSEIVDLRRSRAEIQDLQRLVRELMGQKHAALTLDTAADTLLGLTGQQLTLDSQAANRVLAGPASGANAAPTFRALVKEDLPERWYFLTTPLGSTSWDGDSFSTTSKTLIDLSAVFGVPANVKAVLLFVWVRDSGSATADTYLILGPTTSNLVGMAIDPHVINDRLHRATLIVPCDSNGDIYYQIGASGTGTFDVFMQVWGYYL